MFEFLKDYDYLILPYISQITRVILIPFTALGIVYILGRLLELVNSDRSKNIIAYISIIILALVTGDFANGFLNFDYLFEAFIISNLSAIFYVTVCWRFFNRIDALLDKKVGQDKYDEQKAAEDKRKEMASKLRKEKKENKLLLEQNKKLEAAKKRLAKKKSWQKKNNIV